MNCVLSTSIIIYIWGVYFQKHKWQLWKNMLDADCNWTQLLSQVFVSPGAVKLGTFCFLHLSVYASVLSKMDTCIF
jgi:hypothetical protein